MNFSYWEQKQWFQKFDIAIIGSGIVGLNTAIQLKKMNGNLRIAILEKGFLSAGASTKNAGFACFGSPSELLDDLKSHSEQEVIEMIRKRYQGLNHLKEEVGPANMDYLPLGSIELFEATASELFEKCTNKLLYLNGLIRNATGLKDAFGIKKSAIESNGLSGFENAIQHQYEGQIDTGKMMRVLLSKTRELGVEIFNGFAVKKIHRNSKNIQLEEQSGAIFTAAKVIVATNGFAKKLLPELDVQPARAQVLITKPIPNLKLKGTFHMDEGYYYFRNIDNRVLFGGGRNLDFNGETTDVLGLNPMIQSELDSILKSKILPYCAPEIEYSWSGIMGVGSQKKAIVKKHSQNLFLAVRMGGMGIAIGSQIAREVAEMCLEN